MDNSAQLLADSLLKIWSERDSEKRMSMMQQIYAADIVFYESDSGPAIIGHQAIDSLIGKLQNQWPPEFVFALPKQVVINHGVSCATWTLGIPNEKPVASGTDIAILKHGLINELYLYLDEVDS